MLTPWVSNKFNVIVVAVVIVVVVVVGVADTIINVVVFLSLLLLSLLILRVLMSAISQYTTTWARAATTFFHFHVANSFDDKVYYPLLRDERATALSC